MKKIISLTIFCIILFSLCSCQNNNGNSYKNAEDYKKASAKDYSLNYDDNTFEFVKTNDFDYLILKSDKDTAPDNYMITIKKIDKKTAEEYSKEVEKTYEKSGYTEISSDPSQTFGENSLCVSALADEGLTVYETEIVAFDGGVYALSYHYSTSLEDVAVSDAIYSIVSTFTLK